MKKLSIHSFNKSAIKRRLYHDCNNTEMDKSFLLLWIEKNIDVKLLIDDFIAWKIVTPVKHQSQLFYNKYRVNITPIDLLVE